MAADHTPNELADAIADFLATEPDDPQSVDGHAVDLLERSLDALRRQGEQLDTLTDPELAERLDAALRQWVRVGGFAPAVLGDLRRVVAAMKGGQ